MGGVSEKWKILPWLSHYYFLSGKSSRRLQQGSFFLLPLSLYSTQDLIRAFPEAKIIVTSRDPDSWYDSWWSSIGLTLKAIETQPLKCVVSYLQHPKLKFIHETARRTVPKGCTMSLDTAFQVWISVFRPAKEPNHKWLPRLRMNIPFYSFYLI